MSLPSNNRVPRGAAGGDRGPITVIIPCRNEAGFIDQCLDSLLANDIDQSRLQVLVIDGQSTDGTRDTVRAYAERYPFVTMLDNPKRHTPTALNIGIDHAEGEVIVRLDAHAVYPKDYVRRLVESLHRYEADNVGGAMRAVSRSSSLLGRALAAVSSHPFGVGNAHFRIGAEAPREVDTVPFGCYRRDVFDRVGRFNEHLTRSQDYDFNLRLRRAGGRIVLVPDIVCEYLIRSTIADFGRHRLRDGFWLLYPLRFGVKTYGPRHLVPAAFVLGIIALATLTAIVGSPFGQLLVAVLAIYLGTAVLVSVRVAGRERDPLFAMVMPPLFLLLHVSYGLGTIAGAFAALFQRYISGTSPAPPIPAAVAKR
jgi:succinoglycan biosynthesis protein ExoA